jgi:hypothetical protein
MAASSLSRPITDRQMKISRSKISGPLSQTIGAPFCLVRFACGVDQPVLGFNRTEHGFLHFRDKTDRRRWRGKTPFVLAERTGVRFPALLPC